MEIRCTKNRETICFENSCQTRLCKTPEHQKYPCIYCGSGFKAIISLLKHESLCPFHQKTFDNSIVLLVPTDKRSKHLVDFYYLLLKSISHKICVLRQEPAKSYINATYKMSKSGLSHYDGKIMIVLIGAPDNPHGQDPEVIEKDWIYNTGFASDTTIFAKAKRSLFFRDLWLLGVGEKIQNDHFTWSQFDITVRLTSVSYQPRIDAAFHYLVDSTTDGPFREGFGLLHLNFPEVPVETQTIETIEIKVEDATKMNPVVKRVKKTKPEKVAKRVQTSCEHCQTPLCLSSTYAHFRSCNFNYHSMFGEMISKNNIQKIVLLIVITPEDTVFAEIFGKCLSLQFSNILISTFKVQDASKAKEEIDAFSQNAAFRVYFENKQKSQAPVFVFILSHQPVCFQCDIKDAAFYCYIMNLKFSNFHSQSLVFEDLQDKPIVSLIFHTNFKFFRTLDLLIQSILDFKLIKFDYPLLKHCFWKHNRRVQGILIQDFFNLIKSRFGGKRISFNNALQSLAIQAPHRIKSYRYILKVFLFALNIQLFDFGDTVNTRVPTFDYPDVDFYQEFMTQTKTPLPLLPNAYYVKVSKHSREKRLKIDPDVQSS